MSDSREAREDRELLKARDQELILIARAIEAGASLTAGVSSTPYKLWVFTIRPPSGRHPVSLRAMDMGAENTRRQFEAVVEEWEFNLAESKRSSILVKQAMDKLSPTEFEALRKSLVESA